MRKNKVVCGLITTVTAISCHSGQPPAAVNQNLSTAGDSSFIVADTANKMLGSYLSSISYESNDTDVESFIVNAGQLRKYLDSMPSSVNITHLKIMLAHTLAYANSSNSGKNAGYNRSALTVVIAGCDAAGNYVLYPDNKVLDYTMPCPPICPPGNASNPLIVTSQAANRK